jgi:saccharopine dehydrogenase-like NADP-dependent oxidoreductase
MKRVLIIGAGAQGNVIANVLDRAEDVGGIVLADLDRARAEEVAGFAGSEKIEPAELDAADAAQIGALMKRGDFSLVVNATLPAFNKNILRAACEAGLDYLDMASNEFFPREGILLDQLELEEQWNRAGLRAIINGGGDAGLVNVMAREAAEELDTIDYIGIKDYGVVECDQPVALWSMRTFLEDCYDRPVIWRRGKHEFVDPFSGEEEYYFPPPLDLWGKVFYHIHEEPMTIPLYIGKPVALCDFKIGDPTIEMWKYMLVDLDLLSPRKERFGGCSVSPREVFFSKIPATPSIKTMMALVEQKRIKSQLVLAVDVIGSRGERKLHYKLWTDSPNVEKACSVIPGASDVSWLTSVPASIFALMILRRQVKRKGMLPPEVFDTEERAIFFRGIGEWQIKINKQVSCLL